MTFRLQLGLFLIFCTAPAGYAQVQLFLVNGNIEQPVAAVYNLGSFYQNEAGSARFRLRNTLSTPAVVFVLAADGAGFTLSGAPPLPVQLDARAAFDFTVTFRSPDTGTYSATLQSEGISVLLTATVLPSLTYTADGRPLGAETLRFGSVERGGTSVRTFAIENLTPLILTVPTISVQGGAFTLVGSPSGTVMQTRQIARFDVRFLGAAAGTHEGHLTIGDRRYALAGVSIDPALPNPGLAIDLPQPRSAQQGTLTVTLDGASRASGTGAVTLEFRPLPDSATDPGIVFASGSRTVPLTVSPGDTLPLAALFQTGTTAGTLVFTVTLGGATERQSLIIPAAPVGISSAQAIRSSGSIEVRISGFDNTRTAGQILYSFFDSTGGAIPPGAIRVDSTADFSRFFQTSDAGGNFLLRSVFPVNGDMSGIATFEVEFSNSAGTARTLRTTF